MLTGDVPPNHTIYIKNLNEKVKKDELRRSLYALFSQYGRIVDVVALKTPKLRGQAWVAFSEITAASNAVRQMQSFPFYEKPMRIQYAKTQSDCFAKAEGSYVPKDKKKKQEEKAEKKRKAEEPQSSTATANGSTAQNGTPAAIFSEVLRCIRDDILAWKSFFCDVPGGIRTLGDFKPYHRQGKPGEQETAAAPNNILFVQNLPLETDSMMLQVLFNQFPGFKEVRMVEAKPGIAFVEFTDDSQSSVAMQSLQDFKITAHHPMSISYAKK